METVYFFFGQISNRILFFLEDIVFFRLKNVTKKGIMIMCLFVLNDHASADARMVYKMPEFERGPAVRR